VDLPEPGSPRKRKSEWVKSLLIKIKKQNQF
jgi:hypothetical protein